MKDDDTRRPNGATRPVFVNGRFYTEVWDDTFGYWTIRR